MQGSVGFVQRDAQGRDKSTDRLYTFSAVLCDQFNDGAADYDAITISGHLFGLFRPGDAEPDRAGNLCVLLDRTEEGTEIRLEAVACAGDASGGDAVQKARCISGDHGNTVVRGGSDQADGVNAVLVRHTLDFTLFLIWHIGNDHAVHTGFRAQLEKAFRAESKDAVQIQYHQQGNLRSPATV